MNLKQLIQQDIQNVFFNSNDFAEPIMLNNNNIMAVVSSDLIEKEDAELVALYTDILKIAYAEDQELVGFPNEFQKLKQLKENEEVHLVINSSEINDRFFVKKSQREYGMLIIWVSRTNG